MTAGTPPRRFDVVLVANRGEIARRVLCTLRALGIRSVAVYSEADRDAVHVREADTAVCVGPAAPAESYLRIDAVIGAARATGAQAIHPGYGFLSENAAFARACADAGIVFIGPGVEALETMGDKIRAKRHVSAAGVPTVPGVSEPGLDDDALAAAAAGMTYPILIKPSAGGGGKGMHVVAAPDELPEALATARRVAAAAFGDDTLLLEQLVESPRHIEVQVLGAHTGREYDADSTVAAALAREEEGSTGVGNGVALPHAKSAGAERPMIAFARSRDGVEWNALDGEPVHLVFLISLPEERSGEEHLELLAELSEALAGESCRRALLDAGSASEVLAALEEALG